MLNIGVVQGKYKTELQWINYHLQINDFFKKYSVLK